MNHGGNGEKYHFTSQLVIAVPGWKEAGSFSPSERVVGHLSFHRSDQSGAARQKPELLDREDGDQGWPAMSDRTYIAIDLKSFYASVECMDRNLDPMTTNLVVADESRTEKTICLAVSPSLKAHGIPGRARLFEVIQRVRAVNADRRHRAPRGQFTGKSANREGLPAVKMLTFFSILFKNSCFLTCIFTF